jgi:hypothetical protein
MQRIAQIDLEGDWENLASCRDADSEMRAVS